MKERYNAIVIGGGVGGLCAATLLGAKMKGVLLLESSDAVGGKAGTVRIDGVEVDTGPSVLTLPEVFDDVFRSAGLNREEELSLVLSSPNFRYLFADGAELDFHHERQETLHSVERALGSQARHELDSYLTYAQRIWEAAAPHFVMSEAPSLGRLLLGGLGAWGAVRRIDPLRSLRAAIDEQIASPYLRRILLRYATYNGSDARRAPATLGCIAHVELTLGGYGVKGGMAELPRALARAASKVGVELQTGLRVTRILTSNRHVSGVQLESGEVIASSRVVMNGDVGALTDEFAPGARTSAPAPPSMSAYSGVIKAKVAGARAPHTVLFPDDYEQEFSDIFDHSRVPRDAAIYVCAQSACHARPGWPEHEPLFCMVNAPAIGDGFDGKERPELQRIILQQLVERGIVVPEDEIAWWRTPEQLMRRFEGSRGALYGAASSSPSAAFARPSNRSSSLRGLYLASGSAHPGGGLPMVAQSGKLAAQSLLRDVQGGNVR